MSSPKPSRDLQGQPPQSPERGKAKQFPVRWANFCPGSLHPGWAAHEAEAALLQPPRDTAETVPGLSATHWPQPKAPNTFAFQTHCMERHLTSYPLGFSCTKVSRVPVQENRLDPKGGYFTSTVLDQIPLQFTKVCKTYTWNKNSLYKVGLWFFFPSVFKPSKSCHLETWPSQAKLYQFKLPWKSTDFWNTALLVLCQFWGVSKTVKVNENKETQCQFKALTPTALNGNRHIVAFPCYRWLWCIFSQAREN